MTSRSELSEEERHRLQERHLNGEFHKHELIRFGYLSVPERRRLREQYPDLDKRFEPSRNFITRTEHAAGIFIVVLIGFMWGAGSSLEEMSPIRWIIPIVGYWAVAFWLLRKGEKSEEERNRLYPEWKQ